MLDGLGWALYNYAWSEIAWVVTDINNLLTSQTARPAGWILLEPGGQVGLLMNEKHAMTGWKCYDRLGVNINIHKHHLPDTPVMVIKHRIMPLHPCFSNPVFVRETKYLSAITNWYETHGTFCSSIPRNRMKDLSTPLLSSVSQFCVNMRLF